MQLCRVDEAKMHWEGSCPRKNGRNWLQAGNRLAEQRGRRRAGRRRRRQGCGGRGGRRRLLEPVVAGCRKRAEALVDAWQQGEGLKSAAAVIRETAAAEEIEQVTAIGSGPASLAGSFWECLKEKGHNQEQSRAGVPQQTWANIHY